MVNPDKYIRKAYIDLCKTFIPDVWEEGVPKTVKPLPELYILITNQSRNETEVSKGIENEVNSSKEWLCTVAVDINHVRVAGYFGSEQVDDIEQQIMNVVDLELLVVPGFKVKETRLVLSQPLSGTTSTQTVSRKVITYEHWLNNIY